jgi:Acetyltransferase (GNAT) domain
MIGISLLYIFDNLKMALLDYMAVTPNFQRRGIGRKLFEFTNNEFNRCIPDNIGMFLEVPKENVFDPDELLKRKRRIQFYSSLGVKVLKSVNYLLPIQVNGDTAEEMYLMIKLSKNLIWISKRIQLISLILYIQMFMIIGGLIYLAKPLLTCLMLLTLRN